MTTYTRLCEFPTSDGETLHGLLFQPADQKRPVELALLMVHGVAMNFYSGPLPIIGQALAERGYHSLTINTRGHDWISRAGNKTGFGGASYENLDDCLLDIDGALEWLGRNGYRRFVLVGHSLGCIKSLVYQGIRQRSDVVGVISCSAPKQFYSARVIAQPQFPELMTQAEKLVAEGRGEDFIWAPTGGAAGLFSARTYVSKYGTHEKNDVRPHAARLGCPLLTIAGSAEHAYFPAYAKELAEATGPKLGTYRIVEGANHFYDNHESDVIEIVGQWMEKIES